MPIPRVALGTGGIVTEAGEVVAYKASIITLNVNGLNVPIKKT